MTQVSNRVCLILNGFLGLPFFLNLSNFTPKSCWREFCKYIKSGACIVGCVQVVEDLIPQVASSARFSPSPVRSPLPESPEGRFYARMI